MQDMLHSTAAGGPFHAGEQAVHRRLGLGPRIEAIGRQVIRGALPPQHRAFYPQLPFVVVGSVDDEGRPWASLLVGEAGFIGSPDERHLTFDAAPVPGDPLATALRPAAPLGLLGIELHTRRRNRVNGQVAEVHPGGFSLQVEQTVGNCPQYIHPRMTHWARDPHDLQPRQVEALDVLDDEARRFIARANTLFVATHAPQAPGRPASTDVSHRGGPAGFVQVQSGRDLLVPDYRGNFFFMTLGNLQVYPQAGLLFIDFETGDLLTLTGRAEVLWDGAAVDALPGAERAWRFALQAGWRLRQALPLRWQQPATTPRA